MLVIFQNYEIYWPCLLKLIKRVNWVLHSWYDLRNSCWFRCFSDTGVHAVLKTGSWVRYCIFDLATGKAEQENHFPTSNLAFLGQSERNVAIFTAGQVTSCITVLFLKFTCRSIYEKNLKSKGFVYKLLENIFYKIFLSERNDFMKFWRWYLSLIMSFFFLLLLLLFSYPYSSTRMITYFCWVFFYIYLLYFNPVGFTGEPHHPAGRQRHHLPHGQRLHGWHPRPWLAGPAAYR